MKVTDHRHVVEVHHHPLRNPIGREIDVARFWRNAVDFALDDLPLRRLGNVDFALHLAIHAYDGRPASLRSLLEAALAFRRLSPDQHDDLIAAGSTPLAARSLTWTYALIDETFPDAVPRRVVEGFGDHAGIGERHRRVGATILGYTGSDLELWYGLQAAVRGYLGASGAVVGAFAGVHSMVSHVQRARHAARFTADAR